MTPLHANDREPGSMDYDPRRDAPFTVTLTLTQLLLIVLISLGLGGIGGAAGMWAVLMWVGR